MTCDVRQNTRDYLIKSGLVDENMRIVSPAFFEENNVLSNLARTKYGVNQPGNLYTWETLSNDRTKIIPNEQFFSELQDKHTVYHNQKDKDVFLQTNANVKFTNELKNTLVDFLHGLNIDVDFNANELLENTGFKDKPLAAFDVLQKYMAFAKGQEKLLPRQVATAMYTFLGRKSSLSSALWNSIKEWDQYQKWYNEFSQKQNYDEEVGYNDDKYMENENFSPFAHKMVIIKFLEDSINKVSQGEKATRSFENEDIDKEYFKKRGRLDKFEGNKLERLFKQIYNWFVDKFIPAFEKMDSDKLTQLGLDIAESAFKKDYSKFIRSIQEKGGSLYDSKGDKIELKDYDETLSKDPAAKEIIDNLVNNPYIDFKLSGSLTIRKYGSVYRSENEDVHDIDGVITLDTLRKDPQSFSFVRWVQNEGLHLMHKGHAKQFAKEIKPKIEQLNWYKNLKLEYPNFKMTNAFIGRDHRKGESVTIQGKVKVNGKEYKLDFFLRTDEGNYPEIFDNYWKDWKQIFEAKLNMGRAKDIGDMIYFAPFLSDKYKFTNKGFRYFAFEGQDNQAQVEDMPMSVANPQTIKLVKEAANRMGIDIQELTAYAKKTGLDTTSVNGVADLVKGIIAIAEGKEGVALTEEMVHIATAILEQTNPNLVTEMISKISQFKIYKQVYEAYKNKYKTADGKPDIRKIKKEAVDKLIAELIVNDNQDMEQFPELREEINGSWVRNLWNKVLDWFRGSYRKANIDIFKDVATKITSENIGTVSQIRDGGVFYNLSEKQNDLAQKFKNTDETVKKIEKEDKDANPMLADETDTNSWYEIKTPEGTWIKQGIRRVTDIVKAWYKERFPDREFSDTEKFFNNLKREWGLQGHADFQEIAGRYFNQDGTRKEKPDERPTKFHVPNQLMYDKLEKYFVDLINKASDNGKKNISVYTERIVYDPKKKLAGTIDLLIVDENGKANIYDWKFMQVNGDDVAWFKQGAFNIQLGNYKQILRDAYSIKEFGDIRAIPILMEFAREDKKDVKTTTLSKIAIGSVDKNKVEDLRLAAVSEETEKTGYDELDQAISKLNALLKQVGKEDITNAEEREFKIERLNTIRKAIRSLQATNNMQPLIDVIEVMRKEGDRILEDYKMVYKDMPATTNDVNNKELSEFSDKLRDYKNQAEVFPEIYQKLSKLVYNEDWVKEATTKEEKEALKERKNLLNKLSDEERAISHSIAEIKSIIMDFGKKHIGEKNLVSGLDSPEAVLKGLGARFRGVTQLGLKSLQVLVKLTRNAQGKANQEALDKTEKLISIKDKLEKRGGDIRSIVSKIFQHDKNNKFVNKLVKQYEKKFYDEVDEKAEKGGDRQWLKDNIDIEAYKKEAQQKIDERIKAINENSYAGTKEEVENKKLQLEKEVRNKFDIESSGFNGWDNYILKRHPLPKWESKEYLDIKKDPEVFELYNFIRDYNAHASDIGYINRQVEKTFLPFVRKSAAESLFWDGKLNVLQNFGNSLQRRADDVGYGKINDITGEMEYGLPKYYTQDFTRKDGVNDYSDVSQDVFKNMILYIQQVEKYKYLSEVEGQLNLVKEMETFKKSINTTLRGDVVWKNGVLDYQESNAENAKIYDDFLRVLLYGQKYVKDNSDTGLPLDKVANFVKGAVNKVAGKEVLKPSDENTYTSLVKTLDAANRGFQIKTLGLNLVPGAVNMFGTNIQISTQAGKYFNAREFGKNELKLLGLKFNSKEDKEAFVQMVNTFMPLAEDPSYEIYKQAGMSKVTNANIGDMLFAFMRKPEQLAEKAIFLSLLDNMMIENGKIINIRDFVKAKYKGRFSDAAKYKQSKPLIEKEIDELKKTRSISATKKIENGKLVIPDLDLNNREELQRLTNLTRRISRDATGSLSDNDINMMSMNIWTKSMMLFKNWIPKLTDTRFSEFRKVGDDFSTTVNQDGISEGERYDIGRLRLFTYVFGRMFTDKAIHISNILHMNEKGVKALDQLYEDYINKYEKRTGQKIDEKSFSREDFAEMVRTNLRNQVKEFAILGSLWGMMMGLGFMAPDKDADKASKNFHRYAQKVVDKFIGELSFFYNPLNYDALLSGGLIPAEGIIHDFAKFSSHLIMQTTGMDMSDPTKSFDEVRKKAMPIKYAMKMLPVTNEVLTYLSVLNSDFAKEFDVTIQKQANMR